MCGIFGVIASDKCGLSNSDLVKSINELAKMSESRGKDSSGLAVLNKKSNNLDVFKGPIPITDLLKNNTVKDSINNGFSKNSKSNLAFGHSRLVTNGSQLNSHNNQPVIKGDSIAIHNGIIVNGNELWKKYNDIEKEYEIDTEILLAIINRKIKLNKDSLSKIISDSVMEAYGTIATAIYLKEFNKFVLTSNNGSLYTITKENELIYFASEFSILEKLAKRIGIQKYIDNYKIEPISPNTGKIIDLNDLSILGFNFSDNHAHDKLIATKNSPTSVNIKDINTDVNQHPVVIDLNYIHLTKEAESEKKILEYPIDKVKNLKRCTKCILPETFPYIYFDELGICNYCKNYKAQKKNKSLDELFNLVEPFRKKRGEFDVLLPYSGGRDSTYVLHYVKNELGLNPITYTYDWGMVTDLARRNIARICGKLGVENIIVAANIHWKRKNINKNIKAWLKSPHLGMIPLFMAGDKYFFYWAYKVKKQLGIDLEIWGINKLENTDFKIGFANIKPNFLKKTIYSMSVINQLKLFAFVGKNTLRSPGYLNQSAINSIGSIASRFLTPKKDLYHLFDYIDWDEKTVNDTIIKNYDWEKAVDTDSTWRIGDGTASFYNYVYTLVAGFSENDTFRSNQIREGMINREEALDLVYKENEPRYNSLKWYLEIIGLDFVDTINKINNMKKLYKKT